MLHFALPLSTTGYFKKKTALFLSFFFPSFLMSSELAAKNCFVNALIDKFRMNISNFNDVSMHKFYENLRGKETCRKQNPFTG